MLKHPLQHCAQQAMHDLVDSVALACCARNLATHATLYLEMNIGGILLQHRLSTTKQDIVCSFDQYRGHPHACHFDLAFVTLSPRACVLPISRQQVIMSSPSAQFYGRRFESSVLGQSSMLPPDVVTERVKSHESPSIVRSGQDTIFSQPTEMPYRFTEMAICDQQASSIKHGSNLPHYQTSSSQIGKISLEPTDLPMRWYGRDGSFTSSWIADSKSLGSTGLSTSIDRSNVHHACAVLAAHRAL